MVRVLSLVSFHVRVAPQVPESMVDWEVKGKG
jgi:hypothetical protein